MRPASLALVLASVLPAAPAMAEPPTVTVTAGTSSVSIGPAGVVARTGAPKPPEGPYPGLTSGRIFVPGVNGTPGSWIVRGDGSGPVIVGGEVFVPGPWGSLVPVQPRRPDAGRAPADETKGFRSSSEILKDVERTRGEKPIPDEPPPEPEKPEPLRPIDLSRARPEAMFDAADSRDPSRRASAYQALATLTTPPLRLRAEQKLLLGLDEEDLRLAQLAARSLGSLQSTAAVTKLMALLNLEDAETLAAAAEALGRIGDARALAPLRDLTQHADPKVAQSAVDAVAALERHAATAAHGP